jgi:hypothetical protein
MDIRDANLDRASMTTVRARSGHLQLGFGAGLEERKDAVTRLFHIDRCCFLRRSSGLDRAVKIRELVEPRDIMCFLESALGREFAFYERRWGPLFCLFWAVALAGGFALVFFYGGQKISLQLNKSKQALKKKRGQLGATMSAATHAGAVVWPWPSPREWRRRARCAAWPVNKGGKNILKSGGK